MLRCSRLAVFAGAWRRSSAPRAFWSAFCKQLRRSSGYRGGLNSTIARNSTADGPNASHLQDCRLSRPRFGKDDGQRFGGMAHFCDVAHSYFLRGVSFSPPAPLLCHTCGVPSAALRANGQEERARSFLKLLPWG